MSEITQENKAEDKQERKQMPMVEVSDQGFLKASTIDGQMRICKAMFDSKMVPRSYESPHQILIGMQFALELGLKPLQGLRNIAVINGNPSIWGELPLALARKTGQLEYIQEYLIDIEYNRICVANKNMHIAAWAGVCVLKRKNEPEVEAFFSMDDAKTAGLLSRKNTTPWDTYPKVMLMRRARSQALKIAFADALTSISIAEYDYNYLPDGPEVKDVTTSGETKVDTAKELNQLFEQSN